MERLVHAAHDALVEYDWAEQQCKEAQKMVDQWMVRYEGYAKASKDAKAKFDAAIAAIGKGGEVIA